MLNVDTIKNGLVIDHIKAGYGPKIFSWLGLDKADFCVALIMNAPSKTHGRKETQGRNHYGYQIQVPCITGLYYGCIYG